MKTSNFLLFLAIYGILTGCMMLFNGRGSLENYGVNPIDQYHIATIQYLGISNITMGILSFLLRNEQSPKVAQTILLTSAITTIGSFLKGFHDVFLLQIPSNNFFWVDMTFRLLVGFVCVFLYYKNSKN